VHALRSVWRVMLPGAPATGTLRGAHPTAVAAVYRLRVPAGIALGALYGKQQMRRMTWPS